MIVHMNDSFRKWVATGANRMEQLAFSEFFFRWFLLKTRAYMRNAAHIENN